MFELNEARLSADILMEFNSLHDLHCGEETMSKGKNVLTTGDVAKICNVAPRTVSKWFDSGQLKGYRIPGSKDRRIPMDELLRFMKQHRIPTEGLICDKIRVLIVDSDKDLSQTLAAALQRAGTYEVQLVHTSFEAGLVTQRFNPHVLLVNLFSQGIDASRICSTVRKHEDFAAMKIIAIAGHLSDSECTALLQRGFDDYIDDVSNTSGVIQHIEEEVSVIY